MTLAELISKYGMIKIKGSYNSKWVGDASDLTANDILDDPEIKELEKKEK
jgi:hypothetical protein